jgi:hypothetical protein
VVRREQRNRHTDNQQRADCDKSALPKLADADCSVLRPLQALSLGCSFKLSA